ncbi:MAG TPA: sensor histidine kinase [Polyangiaceae bacterium]|jgi:signal transduction histidine kinase
MAARFDTGASSSGHVPHALATGSGDRVRVRDDLATLLAHDLKTPLAAIALNLDFLLGELASEEPSAARGALEDCRASNARAVRIVSDMAEAVRLATGEQRPRLAQVDARDVLASAVRRVAPEASSRGVRLVWTGDAAVVRADEDLLGRALERLLEHAIRHARSGGAVDVSLRDGTAIVRVRAMGDADDEVVPESALRALAPHFADAALRAQGGTVWTEGAPDGSLLFCVALPA